jgi:hypothetical protein
MDNLLPFVIRIDSCVEPQDNVWYLQLRYALAGPHAIGAELDMNLPTASLLGSSIRPDGVVAPGRVFICKCLGVVLCRCVQKRLDGCPENRHRYDGVGAEQSQLAESGRNVVGEIGLQK